MVFKGSVLLCMLAVIGFTSCKNNDYVVKPFVITGINVVNAGTDTLNFYLNGTRQNGLSSIYPAGATGLLRELAGAQNYQFKKVGRPDVLFSLPLNLTSHTFNSVYITGGSADKTFITRDTVLQLDTFKNTTAVRFVNAAPDAGNLSVSVGDTVKFNTRAFKSTSIFLLTGSGQKRVRVFLPGVTAARLDTTITFQSNVSYTIFAKGLLAGKGTAAFNIGVIINQLSYQ
ncbi:hypothetical protein BH09BAC6_BH09BAC6_23810 [soil metagenome]